MGLSSTLLKLVVVWYLLLDLRLLPSTSSAQLSCPVAFLAPNFQGLLNPGPSSPLQQPLSTLVPNSAEGCDPQDSLWGIFHREVWGGVGMGDYERDLLQPVLPGCLQLGSL